MRIYSFSKVLAFPVFIMVLGILYFEYEERFSTGYWILLPVVLGVAIYTYKNHIDYWYLKQFPMKLDKEVLDLLNSYVPFYRELDEENKEKYHNRLSIYISGRGFKSVGSEMKDVPYDIRAMISTNAIQLTFYKEKFLIGDFDHIFIYKHPFGSPRFKFLHTVETEVEDGVIIYSLEQLIPGITNPELYYNIGMHGYAEAYIKSNPTANFPEKIEADWFDVLAISGISKKQILATIGFESVDILVVMITLYFTYPQKFRKRLTGLAEKFDILFQVNPN